MGELFQKRTFSEENFFRREEMRNEIVEELTIDQRANTEQIEALASRELAKTKE